MKVVRRKLGREKLYGQADLGDNTIEIDSRLQGRKLMEILIHEAMHILNPTFSESKVVEQSKKITQLLWKEKFRRVETEKGDPLQKSLLKDA